MPVAQIESAYVRRETVLGIDHRWHSDPCPGPDKGQSLGHIQGFGPCRAVHSLQLGKAGLSIAKIYSLGFGHAYHTFWLFQAQALTLFLGLKCTRKKRAQSPKTIQIFRRQGEQPFNRTECRLRISPLAMSFSLD